jgi:hypothetical protein
MTDQTSRQDLLVTKSHTSFSPGFLEAAYPVLSPYTTQDRRGSSSHADPTYENRDSRRLLSLSPADAVDLVIATSGLFRDYISKDE